MTPRMNAATPGHRAATEEISGLIERVTFHNDENDFCVLRVKTSGHREETTVVGSQPPSLVEEGYFRFSPQAALVGRH